MASRVRHITFDCTDAYALAQFWSAVLGFTEDARYPNAPDDPEAVIVDPEGRHPGVLFLTVPEGKVVKNRVHFDVQPTDRTRDDEVARLLSLGAMIHEDHRQADGTGWVTMLDPEGNEFCVERSAAERSDDG